MSEADDGWLDRLPFTAWPPPAGDPAPQASITRWHDSSWPRLVRGQRVTAGGREWRVTEAEASLNGDETYTLEPAEVVDARIAAGRVQPDSSDEG